MIFVIFWCTKSFVIGVCDVIGVCGFVGVRNETCYCDVIDVSGVMCLDVISFCGFMGICGVSGISCVSAVSGLCGIGVRIIPGIFTQ